MLCLKWSLAYFVVGDTTTRQETILYVGLDVHKDFCQACVMNELGEVISNERFKSTQEELDEFLSRFKKAKFV